MSIFVLEAVDLVYRISKLKSFGYKIENEPIESTLIVVTSIVSNLILLESIFENNEEQVNLVAQDNNNDV